MRGGHQLSQHENNVSMSGNNYVFKDHYVLFVCFYSWENRDMDNDPLTKTLLHLS